MDEDTSRLGSFQFAGEHLGRFVLERDRSLLFVADRGAKKSSAFAMSAVM